MKCETYEIFEDLLFKAGITFLQANGWMSLYGLSNRVFGDFL